MKPHLHACAEADHDAVHHVPCQRLRLGHGFPHGVGQVRGLHALVMWEK